MCDEDATLELRVKTVKYFKGLMETHELIHQPMDGHNTDREDDEDDDDEEPIARKRKKTEGKSEGKEE